MSSEICSELWEDINRRLAVLEDIENNWSIRVAEEAAAIERAAKAASEQMPGHRLKVDIEYSQAAPATWNNIEVSLERERDGYRFPLALTIHLDDRGRLYWEQPWDRYSKQRQTVLTKVKDFDWVGIMGSMIEGNLRERNV